ncbi:MAG: helix-turn-helix domain-containing protein [Firmicutes bacterium]|nr:helix-turn-helix domain-containing protein [Bacillota bacterium]
MKTMGEIIAYKRKEKSMSQAELAAKLNITDKAVSKWERNLSCPDVNSIPKLAETLGVTVDELLNAKKMDAPNNEQSDIISLILKAVPLAMGIAVVVLHILGGIDASSAIVLLGIGLVCISIGALNERKK